MDRPVDAIGCWVLDTATRQAAAWRQTMDHYGNMWVSVNLSALQLVNPQSMAAIQRILADPMAQADEVVLEVTETALAADVDCGIASLNTLKGFGVRIAVDDFGTGFSSLSTLAALPVDILKIDGSFVDGLGGNIGADAGGHPRAGRQAFPWRDRRRHRKAGSARSPPKAGLRYGTGISPCPACSCARAPSPVGLRWSASARTLR
jgi:EAL domain